MAAQITQNHVHREVSANSDGVGAHQAACNIIWIAEHRLNSLAILLIHDCQNLAGNILR